MANVRSNLFYLDLFAGSNLVLLATGFYDRVHISPFSTLTTLVGLASDLFSFRFPALDDQVWFGVKIAQSLRVYHAVMSGGPRADTDGAQTSARHLPRGRAT
ncbi:MAG: hypothetical protein JSR59_25010 [Proteobacteria bacterium]|nr:hypothetical protein [Pseudomonadota bacterium]